MNRGARRIVSLAPSATNILWELGAHSSLVAVTKWCKEVVPPGAIAGLPVLDDCWSLDPGKLKQLEPDLVIGSVPYRAEVVCGILAQGLRFLAKSPHSIADVYEDIRLLAAIASTESEGERVVANMKKNIERASSEPGKARRRPRVYCEVWPNPLRTCEHWVAELVEAVGGEFVPALAGRTVSSDEVMAADPEIMVLAWAAAGDRARPELVANRQGWDKISAVRGNRIHVMRDELLNTPAPILLRGLEALRAIIYRGSLQGDIGAVLA